MNDADFAALLESIKQASRIRLGLEPPSRVFSVDESGHQVREWLAENDDDKPS